MCFKCTQHYYNTSFLENNQCINEKKCFQCFQCRECSCFLIDTDEKMFSKEIILPDNLEDIDAVAEGRQYACQALQHRCHIMEQEILKIQTMFVT